MKLTSSRSPLLQLYLALNGLLLERVRARAAQLDKNALKMAAEEDYGGVRAKRVFGEIFAAMDASRD
ncbi:hypothetical protein O3S81_25985 [Agrobacterium sp. SOY23]|uniref:hypothetical protein n=1 Tax=Agrobacterium sp. SOY23 TaxID=3014555 RepID=UPI000DD0062D|nr:hypothetical protein [Agrobacterium sp. SOY23]MCZ4433162.1 hypothetical protein [Agrobacterium sp. SOY23]